MKQLTPQELRIGNWYNSVKFNKPVTLTAEDIYEVVFRAEGANISHYINEMFDPIPLDEDWLVKFGFKRRMLSKQTKDDYWIHEKLPKEFSFYLPYFYMSIYFDNVNIPFVHSMQNFFHSLTGTELTRK